MESTNIRAVIQFKDEMLAIVFEKDIQKQEFIQIYLQEFELEPDDSITYELVHVKLGCNIKRSKYLKYEDELILLRPSRSQFL